MWMMTRKSAAELDGILYFLCDALNAVIDDSSYLAHHSAVAPKIAAGLAAAEIAARLAMFREQVCHVSEREFMIVTKLARARHWARELRRHERHLRSDIDAFLALTARCEAMARDCAPDPQGLFDGEAQPKRFLAGRVPGGRLAAEAALSLMERLEAADGSIPLPDDDTPLYLIGGELSVEALEEACERLLARLSAHYGWEEGAPEAIAEDGAEVPQAEGEAEAIERAEAKAPEPDDAATDAEAAAPDQAAQASQEPTADDDPFSRDPAEHAAQPEVAQAT